MDDARAGRCSECDFDVRRDVRRWCTTAEAAHATLRRVADRPERDGPLRRAIIEIKGIYSDQLPAAPGAPRFCNSPDGVVVDAASKALKAT